MNLRLIGSIGTASCLVVATLTACGSSPSGGNESASDSFTFAGFGGALQEAEQQAWFTPFTQESGIAVHVATTPSVAALQTQIESGNVQWDVIEDSQYQADIGCGTLYQEIPDVDRSQIAPQFISNDCGVPIIKHSFVLAYNAAKYPVPPKTVGDIVNTTEFPGPRAVSDLAPDGTLEAALLGDGVPSDELYPLDFERAIAKLQSVKDISYKKTFAEIQDGIANGNFDMALLPNGRALKASEINPDIKVVWGDAITHYDNALLVKNAPNAKAAEKFLSYIATPKAQAALAAILPYGLLTTGPAPQLSKELEPFFPDAPSQAPLLVYQDQKWWTENYDAAVAAWTNAISG